MDAAAQETLATLNAVMLELVTQLASGMERAGAYRAFLWSVTKAVLDVLEPNRAKAAAVLRTVATLLQPGGEWDEPRKTRQLALSERQKQVFQMLDAGLVPKEVAAKLGITVSTVRMHISAVLSLLAVSRYSEAVRLARELGMLENDPWSIRSLPVREDVGRPPQSQP